ncbi:MAG: DUF3967 domain-containing protein [Bacillaceae bacterium]
MYTTKDIENRTNIPANAIRRYSSALEKANYTFSKKGEQRYYFNKDLFLIKQMHQNFTSGEKTVEEIAQLTLEQLKKNQFSQIQTDPQTIIADQNEKFEKFMDAIDLLSKQNQEIIALNTHLLKRKETTEQELEIILAKLNNQERNRDVQLMATIREIQETKKMIAVTKQPSLFEKVKVNIMKTIVNNDKASDSV